MAAPRALAMPLLMYVLALSFCSSVEASVSSHVQTRKLRLSGISGNDVEDDDDVAGDDAKNDVEDVEDDAVAGDGEDAKNDVEDDNEDHDDDDNDTEADAEATQSNQLAEHSKRPMPPPHAEEEAALKKSVEDIEAKLTANLAERTQTQASSSYLSDIKKSSKQIEDSQNRVSKEMQSPAMAKTLATMWRELRMFEVPSFQSHTKEEFEALKKESENLQAELGAANAKLTSAKRKWSAVEVDTNLLQEQPATASTKAPTLQTLQAPPQSQWNFQQWPTSEQQTSWLGTGVYFCFGLMFAFLYGRARMHAKALLPQRDYRHFPSPDGFSFGLFDCFSDANICVIGCCCPCIRWADTLDRQQILPYWRAFFGMFVLMLFHTYSYGLSFLAVTALGVFYRRKLYQYYQIDNASVGHDILTWLCCQPCAIIQEAREASVQRSKV